MAQSNWFTNHEKSVLSPESLLLGPDHNFKNMDSVPVGPEHRRSTNLASSLAQLWPDTLTLTCRVGPRLGPAVAYALKRYVPPRCEVRCRAIWQTHHCTLPKFIAHWTSHAIAPYVIAITSMRCTTCGYFYLCDSYRIYVKHDLMQYNISLPRVASRSQTHGGGVLSCHSSARLKKSRLSDQLSWDGFS